MSQTIRKTEVLRSPRVPAFLSLQSTAPLTHPGASQSRPEAQTLSFSPVPPEGTQMRSLPTPTSVTAPNFHPALCLPGFTLAQRPVCHLCHKHCVHQQTSMVHKCWLAARASSETSVYPACYFTCGQRKAARPSSQRPTPHQRFAFKDQLHRSARQKCKGYKWGAQTYISPELFLVTLPSFTCPLPAGPWLHGDAALWYVSMQRGFRKSPVSFSA